MLTLNGRLGSRKVAQKLLARLQSTRDAANTQSIEIPKRIERGPTDILRALASTVGKDPTAPHFKYHDDPYFIPTSNRAKRTYALSREAGRRAAMWIRQEHAELFTQMTADPIIKDFLPRAVYDENSKVTEKTLHDAIRDAQLSDAVTIYRLLKKDGVSLKTKQDLLELLCYYNDEEPTSDQFPEERWFRRSLQNIKPKWKSNDIVDELFESLKNEDSAIATAAYNALICGTAKYLQVDKAWYLYDECLAKGFPVYVRSFNNMLRLVQFSKDAGDQRLTFMMDVLKTMSRNNVRPDIGTLNAALQLSTLLKCPEPGRSVALSIYKEMTNAGVEPSLGTYFYLLTIFCRTYGPVSEILIDILDRLEGKELEIKDPQDLFFFVKAMDIARNHLMNIDVGHRVHKLLLTGKNYNLIGENYMESIYYRHYLILAVQSESIDSFIKLYDTLVPNIYIPEPDVMNEILLAVEIAGASMAENLLPQLWSHMVMFEHTQREHLMVHILQIMHTTCQPPSDSVANTQYADIAWDIWNRIEGQRPGYTMAVKWNAEMLGNVTVLLIRGGYFDKMLTVLSYLTEKQGVYTGILSKDQLDTILNACLENGHATAALSIISYAANNGIAGAGQMGYKLITTLSLDSAEETKLVNLVGKEVLQLHLG
ncbi:protein PTCD3 homolog, mitochondrial [Neodiprion fabricii]|uniref:protein PTCD3 homolog, mitochondrial n=1 Tax=Neodiprion fabricii TaxID=2872261 RepID=UPI001ED8F956|nr:protein PTCD3 homolog, mitochondrial [Neodiprion fabricii]